MATPTLPSARELRELREQERRRIVEFHRERMQSALPRIFDTISSILLAEAKNGRSKEEATILYAVLGLPEQPFGVGAAEYVADEINKLELGLVVTPEAIDLLSGRACIRISWRDRDDGCDSAQ